MTNELVPPDDGFGTPGDGTFNTPLLEPVAQKTSGTVEQIKRSIRQAARETQGSIRVLSGGGLHPQAVQHLEKALRQIQKAEHGILFRSKQAREAINQLEKARAELVAIS